MSIGDLILASSCGGMSLGIGFALVYGGLKHLGDKSFDEAYKLGVKHGLENCAAQWAMPRKTGVRGVGTL